jgi:hypothetical protein
MLHSDEVPMGRMNFIFALFFDDDNITSKKVLPHYIHDIMNFQNQNIRKLNKNIIFSKHNTPSFPLD